MLQEASGTKSGHSTSHQGSGDLGDEAARMAGDLRDEAESRADRWTRDLGKRGSGLARALESASATLRDEGDERLAGLADQAAEQVERVAGYLENEDPRGLMDDLEELSRSNPAAFLGTAFAAGVLSGRLLRASSPEGGPQRGNGASSPSASAQGSSDAQVDRGGIQ